MTWKTNKRTKKPFAIRQPEDIERLIDAQTSKKESLGETFSYVTARSGDVLSALALSGDREVARDKNSFVAFWEPTNTTVNFDTIFTENKDSTAGRVLFSGSHYKRGKSQFDKVGDTDKDVDWTPSAGLVWRLVRGKPTVVHVLVESDQRGKGLGQELLKSFAKKFGILRVVGPFSKQGAALVLRYSGPIEILESQ